MLVLAPDTLAELRARARAAAPAECCGLLIGGVAQNGDMGAAGPAAADDIVVASICPIPNDDEARYHIPPAEFIAAERAAREAGMWVCGVYHSHPAGSAVPSAADRAEAWPGLVYVIIGDSGTRAWRLADDRRFGEVRIDVQASAATLPARR